MDGDWTGETLKAIANLFDYVVPLSKVDEVSQIVKAYLNGDKSKLKWLVTFKVESHVVRP